MEKKSSHFSGQLGFVLVAAGSAVGVGNLWRFPYLAAKDGGGLFLLIYLALVLTFGFTLLAGVMIIPAVYVFSGVEGMSAGPSLMFVSLPKVFAAMGKVGTVVGILFFISAIFATLTSSSPCWNPSSPTAWRFSTPAGKRRCCFCPQFTWRPRR